MTILNKYQYSIDDDENVLKIIFRKLCLQHFTRPESFLFYLINKNLQK